MQNFPKNDYFLPPDTLAYIYCHVCLFSYIDNITNLILIDKTTEVHSLPQMVAVFDLTSNYYGGNRKFYLKKVFVYFCSELIW